MNKYQAFNSNVIFFVNIGNFIYYLSSRLNIQLNV